MKSLRPSPQTVAMTQIVHDRVIPAGIPTQAATNDGESPGGSLKRSLGMAFPAFTIPYAFGVEAATQLACFTS
ncbi:MAG: hypothetical protein ISS70_06335 [Phycisphaerae bacterium]|nr:hypothetical protein [Phycisphaerae bacterium]